MRHNRAVTHMPQQSGVAASGGDVPTIPFSERRLGNGLRVIVAPDHLAPVVAINLWYDVGSRHETPGRTGFAHLFEHFMFQGSRHVTKAEHFGLIQGAGGVNNATTYFDRTNYFETLPSHQLELALWLEADRMATLLDALDQENLDNQREVVKNEKRQSYDNRPYGSFYEKLMAAVFPADHPYHHTPIGSMEDLDAATRRRRDHVLPDLVRAEQRGAVDRRRRRRGRGASRPRRATSGRSRPIPTIRQPRAARDRAAHRRTSRARSCPTTCPLTRVHFGFRCPPYGTREFDALEVASQILAGGRGSRLYRRLVREQQDRPGRGRVRAAARRRRVSFFGGWVTVRPDSDAETVRAGATSTSCSAWPTEPVTDDELARARALIEAAELGALGRVEEVADRLSMYATLLRPARADQRAARALPVGHCRGDPGGRARRVPRRQPRRSDVRPDRGRGGRPRDARRSGREGLRDRPGAAGAGRRRRECRRRTDARCAGRRAGLGVRHRAAAGRRGGPGHPLDLSVLDVRPGPGRPREYHFPRFERFTLSNGLTVVHAHVPGRALLAAQLLLPGGGWTEPADQAGVTVLTARAMTEGTRRRDAIDFIEAAERLGAEIHADATWETLSASVEVPRSRFGDALALLAEMVARAGVPRATRSSDCATSA